MFLAKEIIGYVQIFNPKYSNLLEFRLIYEERERESPHVVVSLSDGYTRRARELIMPNVFALHVQKLKLGDSRSEVPHEPG